MIVYVRFWRLRVAAEDSSTVPCDTPSHIYQVTQSRQDGVYHGRPHSYILMNMQFPSVHPNQVADKLFSGYVSVSWTLLAAAGTLLNQPFYTSISTGTHTDSHILVLLPPGLVVEACTELGYQ